MRGTVDCCASRISVDLNALRPQIDAYVRNLRAAFVQAPEKGRAVLQALLGDRRMAVHLDEEKGFRVEGLFELALETPSARPPSGNRATRIGGSGGPIRPIAYGVPPVLRPYAFQELST